MPNFAKDDVAVKPVYGPPAPTYTPVPVTLSFARPNTGAPMIQAGNTFNPTNSARVPSVAPVAVQPMNVWTEAANRLSGIQERPGGLYPPRTTGPVNSPQAVLRARVAPEWSLSDKARGVLSKTNIAYNPPFMIPGAGGGYNRFTGDISMLPSPYNPTWEKQALAHELTHKWQYEQTPNVSDYAYQKGLLNDTYRIANSSDPTYGGLMKYATDDWGIDKKLPIYAIGLWSGLTNGFDELGARVAQYAGPQGMPEGYRERYYPGMFANVPPMTAGDFTQTPQYITNQMSYPQPGYRQPFGIAGVPGTRYR